MLRAVAAAARSVVLGTFEYLAAASVARNVVLGTLWLCVVAAARTFVLGTLALDPSLLVTDAATTGVCVLALGSFVLSAGAQACCFAWIGSSRGGLRPGSHVLRPRALR